MRKVRLGTAGVDSGQLMITDPCYVRHFNTDYPQNIDPADNSYSLTGACSMTMNGFGGGLGGEMGVVFGTGGDGGFDVIALIDDVDGVECVVQISIILSGHPISYGGQK